MKSKSADKAASQLTTRVATQLPATQAEIKQERSFADIECNDVEAAALLILLGNEMARNAEHGETWADEAFGGFLAAGYIGLTHKLAHRLHAAHNPQPQD
jgi:hypothetical protein